MWRPYVTTLLLVLAAFFLLGDTAVGAQGTGNVYASLGGKPGDLTDLLVGPPTVPARIHRVEGPDTLLAGQEGLFMALTNVETVTLPFRSRWDFGDGETASSFHTRHRFEHPGAYTVTFSFSNEFGEEVDSLRVFILPRSTDADKTLGTSVEYSIDDGEGRGVASNGRSEEPSSGTLTAAVVPPGLKGR